MLFLIIFSLIQGFSEFLPISSQGHLIIYNSFFNHNNFSELSILELNVLAHLGSLFAVILYYNKLIIKMLKGLKVFYRPDLDKNLSLFFYILASTIPIVIMGFIFGKKFDYSAYYLTLIIGLTSILFAMILYIVDKYCLLIRNQDTFNFKIAIFIGLFQCFALIPGVSRAGANMISLRSLGFNRNFTVRYSNLLSIPVILGASIFILINENNVFINGVINLYVILVLFLSFIFSLIFIHFLTNWVRNSSLLIFIIYRMIFGCTLITYFYFY